MKKVFTIHAHTQGFGGICRFSRNIEAETLAEALELFKDKYGLTCWINSAKEVKN